MLTLFIQEDPGPRTMHTGPLYHVPELTIWGLCPLLFVCVTITLCVLNESPLPRPRKRGVGGSFVDLCPLWTIIWHSDLGGRGRAVPMYYSAHAQWVQRAGESIWASWQNNSWEQVATASHNCLLSSCFPRNSKEEERSQEPGESLCCLQPWDLDWAPSGWQDSRCGQTFKCNSTALILLIIFAGHHEN